MPNPALTLDVRFENQFLVIVSKPPGQASAPLDEHDNSALANALLAHYPSMQGVGHTPLEPGLVHRLDNGTSGLLVAARSQPVFDVLKQALSKGELEKQYLAVVQSSQLPDHGRIDLPLRPSPHNARRVVVAARTAPGARDAKTQYQVVARQPPFALIQVEACRALRHQIRAHLASVGCPLLNDELYGAERVASLAAGRHALHASRIAWCGNHGIPPFDIEEPLPGDLVNLLRELGFRENSASALNPLKTSGTNSRHER
jgi:23S rRNA pseudouridine1911/1915/1917 synthase